MNNMLKQHFNAFVGAQENRPRFAFPTTSGPKTFHHFARIQLEGRVTLPASASFISWAFSSFGLESN
jgi:hypothetical protein